MQISWMNGRERQDEFCANEISNFFPIAVRRRYPASPLTFSGNVAFFFGSRHTSDTFVRQIQAGSNQCPRQSDNGKKKEEKIVVDAHVTELFSPLPCTRYCCRSLWNRQIYIPSNGHMHVYRREQWEDRGGEGRQRKRNRRTAVIIDTFLYRSL